MSKVARLDLHRPNHLDDDSWEAIDIHRRRLAQASANADGAAVVGAAKELVECVARVVLASTGSTLGDEASFPKTVDAAQAHLGSRPADLGSSPEARVIAQSALTMVKKVNELRNDVGTGHGRARLPTITDADCEAVMDASALWSRWTLRILEPLLAGSAHAFVTELRTAITRHELSAALAKLGLEDQSPDDQRLVGMAFGQRAAGGFGNAYVVGVTPPADSGSLGSWPTPYRLGLAEGLVLDWNGQIEINKFAAESLIQIIAPVPQDEATPALSDLVDRVRESSWSPQLRHRGEVVDAAISELRRGSELLQAQMQRLITELADELEKRFNIYRIG